MKYIPPTGSIDPNAAYIGKNPAIGQQGSKVPPKAIEHPMREIVNVIRSSGLTPDENATDQLLQAIHLLDRGTFRTVSGSPSAAAPVTPADGDEYAVAASATGVWAGRDGQIARWDAAASEWKFSFCRIGRIVKVADTDTFYRRSGAGWSPYTFGTNVNPYVAWGGITGTLANQSDLAAALSGKLALLPPGGALQAIVGGFEAAPPAHGATLVCKSGGAPNYSGFWSDGSGHMRVEVRDAASNVRVRLGAAPTDASYVMGNVGIGTPSPQARLHVAGALLVEQFAPMMTLRRVGAAPQSASIESRRADGTLQWVEELGNWADNSYRLHRYNAAGVWIDSPFGVGDAGAWLINGNPGASGQVLKTNGSSALPSWVNAIDLLSAAELRAKIGGQTVLASCSYPSAPHSANGTVPAGIKMRGCTVTTHYLSGYYYAAVAFHTPAPSADYIVTGSAPGFASILDWACTARTVNGFNISLGDYNNAASGLEFTVTI